MSESGFVDVNGGRLYYEVEGSGHPLVLVHAGVANLRMWDEQVPAFAERYRTIRYDTRGWGRSETEQVEFANHEDLAAVLDQVGAASAHVLGLSRGAGIALDFALDSPDRADSLIFAAGGISGFNPDDSAEMEAVWQEADRHEAAHDWDWVADFETRMWVDGPGQRSDRVDPAVRERVHDWILTTYREEKNEGRPRRLDPPANARLEELSSPTLVMVGDLDEPSTQLSCRRLAEQVPGARLEVFHGAAHMINLEQPERFNRLVLEFLAGLS